jgi:hypothetical protein
LFPKVSATQAAEEFQLTPELEQQTYELYHDIFNNKFRAL